MQKQKDQAPAHLRYSGSSAGKQGASMPFNLEGLCPHHEQAFAAQLMAQQLQNMTGVVGNSFVRVWKDYLRKHQAPPKLQRIYPLPGPNRVMGIAWKEMQMDDLVRQQGITSPSHGGTSSASQTERRHSRHLLEMSEAQKRQELLQAQQIKRPERSATKTNLDDKDKLGGLSSRLKAQIPSATFVNYETFKISQMSIDNEGKEEANGKDIVDEAAKKESQGHHKGHRHSGRKSRMGMHDSEGEEEDPSAGRREGPDFVHDPHAHRPPRVKSAKGTGEELNSAIQSIKDLRQSLASSAANTNLTPTAGNYIKKLIKQELKQTDEDIGEITAKLQTNIDEKEKQFEQLASAGSTRSTVQRENSSMRSEQVSSARDRNSNKTVGKTETVKVEPPSAQTKPKADSKRDNRDSVKIERKESANNNKYARSTTNFNGNATTSDSAALNGKLVDAYHIPDATQQMHAGKPDGFRGGKLAQEFERGYTKLPSKNGGKSESTNGLHYSSATDLTQPGFHQMNGSGGSKMNGSLGPIQRKRGVGIPRSASSSSSREEGEPRAASTTQDKYEKMMERERIENAQRVKSAKNVTRQVVETIPTKISLMITQEHEADARFTGSQFLPMSRPVRGPFGKSPNNAQQKRGK